MDSLLGIVVIGRNEGARLVRCLASVAGFGGRVVYVDSGSTDDSVVAARQAGARVIELDMSTPFTAARGRNEGIKALGLQSGCDEASAPEFIQFIDGDCEMQPEWLEKAIVFLQSRTDVAVVSGRLRERYPDATPYNALCDAEWNGPEGEAENCGGIVMVRSSALAEAGLFNPRMIAGEEPELCLRLRRKGWKIWRIRDEMALHDAAMVRFGQFWKRMRRGGFAFALWTEMHGSSPDRLGVAQTRRALLWGGGIPLVIIAAILIFGSYAWLLWLIYPIQILRTVRRGGNLRNTTLMMIGKFAEAQGVVEFYVRKWSGRPAGLIEHK